MMQSYYKSVIPIIDDSRDGHALQFPGKDGAGSPVGYGYVPRDFAVTPPNTFGSMPSEIQVYPDSDWDALYDEQEAQKSSLEHLYLSGSGGEPAFVNLDQNGHGYCWAYSAGTALMLARLRDNQPLVRLNPHSVAAIIKNGRDEGGWCGLSAEHIRRRGMAEEGNGPGQWPLHSRSLANDSPECRASSLKYTVTEDFVDLAKSVYDQNMTELQLATCLFNNLPGQVDFNHWSHSVGAVRWVRIERGSFGLLILNSWKGWGRHGLAVLQGSKRRPDGCVVTRVVKAA
jgi:hypothetical protein